MFIVRFTSLVLGLIYQITSINLLNDFFCIFSGVAKTFPVLLVVCLLGIDPALCVGSGTF